MLSFTNSHSITVELVGNLLAFMYPVRPSGWPPLTFHRYCLGCKYERAQGRVTAFHFGNSSGKGRCAEKYESDGAVLIIVRLRSIAPRKILNFSGFYKDGLTKCHFLRLFNIPSDCASHRELDPYLW